MKELQVGTEVRCIKSYDGLDCTGQTGVIDDIDSGDADCYYGVTFEGGDDLWYPRNYKVYLVPVDKKGDTKVEKQIKGLNVKLGSKVYDTECGNTGELIAGTTEHCIYKCFSDGKERVAPWNRIKLEIEVPKKLLLPKEEKEKIVLDKIQFQC